MSPTEINDAEINDAAINSIMEERERARAAALADNATDLDEFDKSNSRNDWIAYVNAYTGRAAEKVFRNEREGQNFRANMVKAGALIVAAIEAHDKGYC